jgi:hypothetical protein
VQQYRDLQNTAASMRWEVFSYRNTERESKILEQLRRTAAASSSPTYLPDKRGRRSHGSGRDGGGGTVGTGSEQSTRTARRRARVRRRTQVRPRRSRGGVPHRGRQSDFLLRRGRTKPAWNNEVGSIFLCFVGFTGWLWQLCVGGSVGAWRFRNAHVERIWAGLQMREFAARLQRILFPTRHIT